MTKQKAIEVIKAECYIGDLLDLDRTATVNKALDVAIQVLEQQPCTNLAETSQGWIPIKTRPMTEKEKEEIGHEYAYMYDCPLPDEGQDVLVTDCYGNVEEDTFCRDYEGFYFETNCDDGEVIAWMPKPQPYRESEEV